VSEWVSKLVNNWLTNYLTLWIKVPLKNPAVSQSSTKGSVFCGIWVSVSCSQQHVTCSHPESGQSSSRHSILFLQCPFWCSPSTPRPLKCSFFLRFPTRNLYEIIHYAVSSSPATPSFLSPNNFFTPYSSTTSRR